MGHLQKVLMMITLALVVLRCAPAGRSGLKTVEGPRGERCGQQELLESAATCTHPSVSRSRPPSHTPHRPPTSPPPAPSVALCAIALGYLIGYGKEPVKEALSFIVVLLVASIPIAIEIVCTTTLALGSRQVRRRAAAGRGALAHGAALRVQLGMHNPSPRKELGEWRCAPPRALTQSSPHPSLPPLPSGPLLATHSCPRRAPSSPAWLPSRRWRA